MSLGASRSRLLETFLDFLWAQWTALGVPGVRGGRAAIVDPEALLLATCLLGRYEPRLFDEVLGWLVTGERWVDLTRLRTLLGRFPSDVVPVLAGVARYLEAHGGGSRWRILAEKGSDTTRPLFVAESGAALPLAGELDPWFAGAGVLRRTVIGAGALAPDLASQPRLALRALFGVGARCEVMLYLLTHDEAHQRLMARRAGYSEKAVRAVVADLGAGGFLRVRAAGRQRRQRLLGSEGWWAILGHDAGAVPAYVDWATFLGAGASLWIALDEQTTGDQTPYMVSSKLRRALRTIGDGLEAEGTGLVLGPAEDHPGEQFLGYVDSVVGQAETVLGYWSHP